MRKAIDKLILAVDYDMPLNTSASNGKLGFAFHMFSIVMSFSYQTGEQKSYLGASADS